MQDQLCNRAFTAIRLLWGNVLESNHVTCHGSDYRMSASLSTVNTERESYSACSRTTSPSPHHP